MIRFEVAGNPKALKRHRNGKFGNYDPSAPDKETFLILAHKHRPAKPFTGVPLRVSMYFHMPRPKNHYGTGKNLNVLKKNAPYWHIVKPDTTNLEKMVEDALSGVFWSDDCIICAGEKVKRYSDTPKTIICIEELEQ